jgi:hypothetical protein
MKKLILLLALGMLICLPGMASAEVISLPGMTSGDWSSPFGENGYYAAAPTYYSGPSPTFQTFDEAMAVMVSGAGFSSALSSLSGGWTSGMISPTEVYASGPAPADGGGSDVLYYTYNFAGLSTSPLTFDWFIYNNGAVVGGESVVYDGNGGYTYGNPTAAAPAFVPLPPSVLLLGSGLFGLGILGRRKIFKA